MGGQEPSSRDHTIFGQLVIKVGACSISVSDGSQRLQNAYVIRPRLGTNSTNEASKAFLLGQGCILFPRDASSVSLGSGFLSSSLAQGYPKTLTQLQLPRGKLR